MYMGLRLKYSLFLSDFNETLIIRVTTDFRKTLKYKIIKSWKSVQWAPSFLMRSYGQTNRPSDMTKLIVVFRILRTHLKICRYTFKETSTEKAAWSYYTDFHYVMSHEMEYDFVCRIHKIFLFNIQVLTIDRLA
jgi:hypothetical protein